MTQQFISYLKFKRVIIDTFAKGNDPVKSGRYLSDDQFAAIFEALLARRLPKETKFLDCYRAFLYAGCVRFDRWFAPSPFVVAPTQKCRFAKFSKAFAFQERHTPTNSPVFEIHRIQDEVFSRFGLLSSPHAEAKQVNEILNRLDQVPTPKDPVKANEFSKIKNDLVLILIGIRDRILKSILKFKLPYIIHVESLTVSFLWRGSHCLAHLTPHFQESGEGFLAVEQGSVMIPEGSSRWTSGTAEVTIEVARLIDGSAYTESLQKLLTHDSPVDGWPQSFTAAFEIITDLTWHLREHHNAQHNWIPAPRDLSHLEYSLVSSAGEAIIWIVKGSPASTMRVFRPSERSVELKLGEIGSISWHQECRSRAVMYLELGDTNEALFWVNVGVEALISQRFNEIENSTGIDGLVDDLMSPRQFWHEAEEIVSRQFPNLAGKVNWPAAERHTSVFTRIKALYRRVPMQVNRDELLSKYRQVQRRRNALFHGTEADRVSVDEVVDALRALRWMEENMQPSPTLSTS